MELPYDPEIPILGIYPKKLKTLIERIHCSIIYNSQGLEAGQVPINRWVDGTSMVHLYNRIWLGCKKEEKFPLCNSMNGPK